MRLKLRKTGSWLGTTWPNEVMARLNLKAGDELFVIETPQGDW